MTTATATIPTERRLLLISRVSENLTRNRIKLDRAYKLGITDRKYLGDLHSRIRQAEIVLQELKVASK